MSNPCACPAWVTPQPASGPFLADRCGGSQFLLFIGVLDAFLRTQCDILDPCRQPKNFPRPLDEYDFIVVGGGSAGSVIASRLSANPRNQVLLLEAGGSEPTDLQVPAAYYPYAGSPVEWGFYNEPSDRAFLGSPRHSVRFTVGKMIGGSSSLNGMIYLRGNPEDYDEWQQLGNEGWSYDQVLPYFLRSEGHQNCANRDPNFHNCDGPLKVSSPPVRSELSELFLRAARSIGLEETDMNAVNNTGAMLTDSTIENGVRMSAAKAFLRPHVHRRNLHILLNTQVTKVLLKDDSNQAYAVQAVRDGHRWVTFRARKEIIISAGAVNSPKLLLLSGIGSDEELSPWNIKQRVNLPGVGLNLQNHLGVSLAFQLRSLPEKRLDWSVAAEYLLHRRGDLASMGSVISLRFPSDQSPTPCAPELQYTVFNSFLGLICSKSAEVEPADTPNRLSLSAFVIHNKPKSCGQIRLGSADPLQPPLIFGNELDDPDDAEVLLNGVQKILRLYESDAFDGYDLNFVRGPSGVKGKPCGKFDWRSDDYWRCMIRYDTLHFWHPTGTCKMGPATDAEAVVDAELRVHGVDGLRVADASIMPRIVASNTNPAAIMIGEKAADMIAQFWEGEGGEEGEFDG